MDSNIYEYLKDKKYSKIELDNNFHSNTSKFTNNIIMNKLKKFSEDTITDSEMSESFTLENLLTEDSYGKDLTNKVINDYGVYGSMYLNLLGLYEVNSKLNTKYKIFISKIVRESLKVYEDYLKIRFISNNLDLLLRENKSILKSYSNVEELVEIAYGNGVNPKEYKSYIDYIEESNKSRDQKLYYKEIIQKIMLNYNDRVNFQKDIINYRLSQYLDIKVKATSRLSELMVYMNRLLSNYEYNLFSRSAKRTIVNGDLYVGDFDFRNKVKTRYSFFISDPDTERPNFLDYKLMSGYGYKEFDDQIYKFLGKNLFTVFDYENIGNLNASDIRYLYLFSKDILNKIVELENKEFLGNILNSMKDDPGYNNEIILVNTIKELEKVVELNKNDNTIDSIDRICDIVNLDKAVDFIDSQFDKLSDKVKNDIETGKINNSSNESSNTDIKSEDDYLNSILKDNNIGIKKPDKVFVAVGEMEKIAGRLDKMGTNISLDLLNANKHNYEIRDFINKINHKLIKLKDKLMWILAGIGFTINEAIISVIKAVVDLICKLLRLFKRLLELLKCILGMIISGIKLLVKIIQSVINIVFDMVNKIITVITHTINKIASIVDTIKDVYNFIKDLLSGKYNIMQSIKDIVKKAIDKAKSYAEAVVKVVNNIVDMFSRMNFDRIKSMLRVKLGGSLGGGSFLNGIWKNIKFSIGKLLESFKWESIKNLFGKIKLKFKKIKFDKLFDILKSTECSVPTPNLESIAEKILNALSKLLDLDKKCGIKTPKITLPYKGSAKVTDIALKSIGNKDLCNGGLPDINNYTKNLVRNSIKLNTPRLDVFW